MNPRPRWMLEEEAKAIFGRISSSVSVQGQIVQLGAALAVSRHLLADQLREVAGLADWPAGHSTIGVVFDSLQEGLDHLDRLVDRDRDRSGP